jgi:hypothetical protein
LKEVSKSTWEFDMTARLYLRTHDLALAGHISVQQVHNVVLLRDAGYPFNVIQSVLDELVAGRSEKAIVAVEKRREELTRISWSCIEALTFFRHYVSEFGPQHSFASR